MTDILDDPSPPALAEAIEASLYGAFASYGRGERGEVHDEPDLTWFTSGIPFAPYNGVVRARIVPDHVESTVSATLRQFSDRRLPMEWWTGPSTHPHHLSRLLHAHGLIHAEDLAGMAIDLHALPADAGTADGLSITPIDGEDALRSWLSVIIDSFGFPAFLRGDTLFFKLHARLGLDDASSWRYYLGWRGGEPVSASALFLHAGVAGLYNLGTIAGARRHGVGRAMTAAPLRDAGALGYRVGVLQATPAGLGLYRRLGFQQYCLVSRHTWIPTRLRREAARLKHRLTLTMRQAHGT